MILTLNSSAGDHFVDYVANDLTPDKVILYNEKEWQYNSFGTRFHWEDLINFVNKKNCDLYIINGVFQGSPILHDPAAKEHSRTHLIYYPYYFLRTWHDLFNHPLKDPREVEYNYHFVSLNGKPHWFRCLQMDLLAKHGLLDKAAISWNSSHWTENRNDILCSQDYDWKYWTPRYLSLDQQINDTGWRNQIPDQYYKSFAQLVPEATVYAYFITEKTVPALRLLKPFLISGRAGIHKVLQDYGFLLYDEIFDYGFDLVESEQDRFNLIAENFLNLCQRSLSDLPSLYATLYPKLLFNQQRYRDIVMDPTLYDPFIIDLCENHTDAIRNETIYGHYLKSKNNESK